MRLYLDTMIWVYALENHPTFGKPAQQLLGMIRRGQHTTLTSSFLLAELLVPHVRRQDRFVIASYRRMLSASPAMEVVPFGEEAALHFAAIRAAHKVKQPDAIHLALAASAGADAFLTIDNRLKALTIPGINLVGDLSFPLAQP